MSYTSADQSHPYAHRFIDFLLERMKDSFKVNKDVSFGERNGVPESQIPRSGISFQATSKGRAK